ncbi:unnamed protein product [Clonostachys byssicola]|uniref:NAD-dependent epimerase/dehydratase domain-containing protein n=1 Tax=Clonostachys byssicola TaxID=160290 RepID=A0A9N9UBR9_9HYPO|nr:unnamed protein product [Clonostachys byssicola]
MAHVKNVLVTGGAGFIGGSVVATLIARTTAPVKDINISTIIRSDDQAKALSKLGINVIQADLSDEKAILDAVLNNEIDLIVHAASSFVLPLGLNLVRALGQRGKITGRKTYFINSSITTPFSEDGGWPEGEVKDTDNLYETEKQINDGHPVRITDIGLVEESKAQGVEFFNVAVPVVYGRGSGEWKKLSTNIPAFVRKSVEKKVVYKFEKDGVCPSLISPPLKRLPVPSCQEAASFVSQSANNVLTKILTVLQNPPAIHVADLADLYVVLVEKILKEEPIPNGANGYYFGFAHRLPWWKTMERIAAGLHARGLVTTPTAQVWPSWEEAAEQLKWPVQHIHAMGAATGQQVAVNPYLLGWQPKWNQKRFLDSIDDEIQAALDDKPLKSTLFDTIL